MDALLMSMDQFVKTSSSERRIFMMQCQEYIDQLKYEKNIKKINKKLREFMKESEFKKKIKHLKAIQLYEESIDREQLQVLVMEFSRKNKKHRIICQYYTRTFSLFDIYCETEASELKLTKEEIDKFIKDIENLIDKNLSLLFDY